MHFSPSQALLGLCATLIPSALGAPANSTHGIYSTNSTTEITPTLVDRSSLAAVPRASNLACYKQKQGCKYKDVYDYLAKQHGEELCKSKNMKYVIAKPGWPGTVAFTRNPFWVSYNMMVEWKEGCTAPGDGTMDVGNPGPGISCLDVVWQTWANCNNGGRGGKIDFGCLTYHYNIINGNEAGHGYCVNLPFDNSTLEGGY